MKKIFAFCVFSLLLLIMTGCSNSNDNVKNVEKEEKKLSFLEQSLLDSIIDISTEYADSPESIRIIEGGRTEWLSLYERFDVFYVKLTGINSLGGSNSKCYEMYSAGLLLDAPLDTSCEAFDNYDYCSDNMEKGKDFTCNMTKENIKNVNNALKKHWEDLGL